MLAVLDMKLHCLFVLALILMLQLNVHLTTLKMLELSASVSIQVMLIHSPHLNLFHIAIYPVRLSDGTASSGHVEKFFNERWGTVCDDSFDTLDGQVVCSQLKQGTISRIANPMEFPVGTDDQPIWLDEVQCMGDERWLSTCPWR